MAVIQIENNGTDIESTNYWNQDLAKEGFLYLSFHDGVARLLVPPDYSDVLGDMTWGAKRAILTRGMWNGRDAYELMFEGRKDEPFAAYVKLKHVDLPLSDDDQHKEFLLTVWTREGKIGEVPAWYRTAEKLPYLQPYES